MAFNFGFAFRLKTTFTNISLPGVPPEALCLQVKTDELGTSNDDQFTLPAVGGPYDVDWRDGSPIETGLSGPVTHTFLGGAGTYEIEILPNATAFQPIKFAALGDKDKAIAVLQWGNSKWNSMLDAFNGCSNLLPIAAPDIPDITLVTTLQRFLKDCPLVTSVLNIGSWDVTSITTAVEMLTGASFNPVAYDALLTGWNAQAVTNTVTLDVDAEYCLAEADRLALINDHSWTINDNGLQHAGGDIWTNQADEPITTNGFYMWSII